MKHFYVIDQVSAVVEIAVTAIISHKMAAAANRLPLFRQHVPWVLGKCWGNASDSALCNSASDTTT